MKRILVIALALLMVFSLFAACGSKDKAEGTSDANSENNSGTKAPVVNEDNTVSTGIDTGSLTIEDLENAEVYPSDTAVLNIAGGVNPTGFTQVGNFYASTMSYTSLFHETLFKWDAAANYSVPFLLEDYEWIDDLTLRLYLKEGITSSMGDPLTANDVYYSFNVNYNTPTLSSYYNFFDMEKTKVIDDYTMDLVLADYYPYLIMDLAHAAYQVVVEASVEKAGGIEALKFNPVAGTGPYTLVDWVDGDHISCERREDYWGTMPYYKYVNCWVVTDTETRFLGVEAGDYNVCMMPSATAIEIAETSEYATAWTFAHTGRGIGIGLNSDNEYLKSKAARQAIALAIDYDSMVTVACGGYGIKPEGNIINQLSPYYTPLADPSKNYQSVTDIDRARDKLIEAGYPDGFSVKLLFMSGESAVINAASLLKNQLGQIGIDVELLQVERGAYTEMSQAGDFDMVMGSGANPNPRRNLTPCDPRYDHKAANGSAGQNWFEDLEITTYIDNCLNAPNEAALIKAWADIEAIACEYLPRVNLVIPYSSIITSSDIVGLRIDSMAGVDYCSLYPQEYLDGPAA